MGKKLKAIDFFCGAGGITCGFQQAGIQVLAGIDVDVSCRETYEKNNVYKNYKSLEKLHGGSKFLNNDINDLTFDELSSLTGIKPDDDDLILVGCSPCQFWSQINTTRNRARKTKNLLSRFQAFVEYFRPGYVVIENVPGLEKRKKESKLDVFLDTLSQLGYGFEGRIVNSKVYDIPQTRKRYVLIASRVNIEIKLPQESKNIPKLKDFIGVENGFPQISAGHTDSTGFQHFSAKLSPFNIERLLLTPMGGNRLSWAGSKQLQIPCYEGKDNIFRDVYGRLNWDKIGPTITTKFLHISNGRFGHPDEDRGLSLREGATLQTFPKKYVFHGQNMSTNARHIGNAVPPRLAEKIALQILKG